MTKFTIHFKDGTTEDIDAPDSTSQVDLARMGNAARARRQSMAQPQRPQLSDQQRETGNFFSRSAGLVQGALDYPEEAGRMAEHVAGKQLFPEDVKGPLRSFRNYARSSEAGKIAETISRTGIAMTPYGRVARGGSALMGALEGATIAGLQPVEGRNYGSRKTAQILGGGGLGAILGSPMGRQILTWLATNAAVHGAGAAAFPHQWWAHWPLHRLASMLYGSGTGPAAGRIGLPAQRAVSSLLGSAMGGGPQEESSDAETPRSP